MVFCQSTHQYIVLKRPFQHTDLCTYALNHIHRHCQAVHTVIMLVFSRHFKAENVLHELCVLLRAFSVLQKIKLPDLRGLIENPNLLRPVVRCRPAGDRCV